jgi:hypothetical protein
MKPERRCTPRERPKEISYIQFESEGGGIVVNASEQGLAFHLAAALRQPGPIQLCVSPNPTQQIKLTADIAWMDKAKKSGGLRFTGITADARNQIRQWLTQTGESEDPDRNCEVPSCAPKEKETGPCSPLSNATAEPLPPTSALTPTSDNAMSSRADAGMQVAPPRSISTTTLPPAPFSQEKQISVSRPRLVRRAATAFLIFVFALFPIVFVQDFRLEIGNSLIRIGEKLKGDSNSHADAPSSIPVQSSCPSAGNTPSVPNPIPETSPKETVNQPEPAPAPTQGTGNSTDSLLGDTRNTRQRLGNTHAKRGRSTLARQLWSAVGAGDTSAEVTLAQLYVKGEGVPKNCEQARILLKAASRSGNLQAQEQLRKLNANACH